MRLSGGKPKNESPFKIIDKGGVRVMGFEPISPWARDTGSQSRHVYQFRHTRSMGRRPKRLPIIRFNVADASGVLWLGIPFPISLPDYPRLPQAPQGASHGPINDGRLAD